MVKGLVGSMKKADWLFIRSGLLHFFVPIVIIFTILITYAYKKSVWESLCLSALIPIVPMMITWYVYRIAPDLFKDEKPDESILPQNKKTKGV